MIELIQFSWSPYCFVQKRILEFSGSPFKITDIPAQDRSLVWRITRKRYYGVPVIRDGSKAIFETDPNSQVIAKYLDFKFGLGLFPANLEGVQSILWRFIENEVEEMTFKLNDAQYEKFVPLNEQLPYLRHKERKFGAGCLAQWRRDQKKLLAELSRRLLPFEEMLLDHRYLLGDEPRFVDFDLMGMLDNLLFSGAYKLPASHTRLKLWRGRLETAKFKNTPREKLRS